MSSYAIENTWTIKPSEVISAYNKHGNDFLVIDIDNIKQSKYAQYLKLYYKLANDKVVYAPNLHINPADGLKISKGLNDPFKRKFKKMFINVSEEEDVENENYKALKIICEAYEYQMTQLVKNNTIVDKKNLCKMVDGKQKPVYINSVVCDIPMSNLKYNKETNDYEESSTYNFKINIPQKRFWTKYEDEVKEDIEQFKDACYLDEDGNKQEDQPVLIHTFQPKFFNAMKSSFNPKTGKKMFEPLGEFNEENRTYVLNNTNIQNFLTKGSEFVGHLKIGIQSVKLKTMLVFDLDKNICVKVKERQNVSEEQDFEDMEAFASKFSDASTEEKKEEQDEDTYEDDEEDF